MRLKKLELTNFMGVRHFVLEPDGKDVSVFGRNATGKTTIASAVSWLLFDKDSRGNAQFEIKTLDPSGDPLHNLEHTVEGIFEVNGKKITLKKVYMEKWTKKRGASKSEFTGHTTDYFVNEVPVQMKEYKEQVSKVADEELFRLLTTPSYFPETLSWQKRRSILLDVCGDITDQDVIASDKKLAPLAGIIAERTLEEHKKTVQATMTKINKQLESIPVRIDELNRSLPAEEADPEGAAETITATEREIDSLKEKKAALKAGNQSGFHKELNEAEKAVFGIESEHRKEINEAAAGKEGELRKLQAALIDMSRTIDDTKAKLDRERGTGMVDERPEIEAKIEESRQEWIRLKAMTYEPELKVCQACGQDIPEDPDAEAKFNQRKAESLEANVANGNKLKKQMEAAEKAVVDFSENQAAKIKGLESILATAEKENEERQAAFDALQKETDAIRSRPVTDRPDYKAAVANVEKVKAKISGVNDNSDEIAKLDEKIEAMASVLAEARRLVALVETKEKTGHRIEELKAEEKKLAAEYEKLQGELELMESFIRTKVNMLEESINSRFELARFKLFKEQINGGLAECCEVTCQGVPYSSGLNNGARVAVGIDIIKTLSKHYGFAPMIIVDNRESINELPETDCQVISLCVSDDDTKLRVETVGMEQAA